MAGVQYLLSGGIEGATLSSKLLKWPVCSTVLSDGTEGSAPSSKLLKWHQCDGIEGSPLSSKLHAFDVGAMW